ncbi:helix-turn-helix domain-containing protein [Dyadobacter sp. CY312]|uniref:helix-turn-helix domain-containing protein n=1 Tax=Dyadobacter sp. CY312 TaxID=2907303 RepID=UPI001F30E452|nr:helix-turn-helix transcriptional regulator [Dyadobacter sp. CY312]MCE7044548.1 helix-turn-helix domain-containing protein [Dyadobacter sp. CY312]
MMTTTDNNQSTAGRRILRNVSSAKRNRIELNMTISARLDDLMKKFDLSTEQLGTKVGVEFETVDCWLSGTHVFTTDELSDIATALKCSPKDLMSLATPIVELSWIVHNVVNQEVLFLASSQSRSTEGGSDQVKTYSTTKLISGYQPN